MNLPEFRRGLDGDFIAKIYDKALFQEIEADSEIQSEESAEEPFVSEEQRLKNRYLNIGAVERTRVRIHSLDGTADAYVNANYIDVRELSIKWIACLLLAHMYYAILLVGRACE